MASSYEKPSTKGKRDHRRKSEGHHVSPSHPASPLSERRTRENVITDGSPKDTTFPLFINRELSWLEFNKRVLEEAQDESVPLLERVKFLSIFSSNLDEFFMVRVAGVKRQISEGNFRVGPDGLMPNQALAAISARVHELVDEQHRCFLDTIHPQLAEAGVHFVTPSDLDAEQERFLEDFFRKTLFPVLTPLAIDPGHPFPHLANRSLYLVAGLRALGQSHLPQKGKRDNRWESKGHHVPPFTPLAMVHIPGHVVPRFISLPAQSGQYVFILLEDVLQHYLPRLYQGYEILSCHAVRVTRDADFELPEDRLQDMLTSIEEAMRERRMGTAVRLQYDTDLPANIVSLLVRELDLQQSDLYASKGFTAFTDLFQLYATVDLPQLKDRPMPQLSVPAFERTTSVWQAIRDNDILVHHPYQSFDAVTNFVEEATRDPKVLAIKMTLYRVSPSSPIARALTKAAEAGKEVAVLVELRARFDEEANISWARALEEVGAHVVYGLVGYKTHCKACLVVRQEEDGIRRYCHLATGNYNVKTSSIYCDLGLFTCRESFGEDLTQLFNMLTGYTQSQDFHHLLVAPTQLRDSMIARIRREIEHAQAGRPARLIAKLNSLVDQTLIEELYAASQAGVQIDLIVRGICCLRPGLTGVSDNIRVISIIDRFLEHARIFYFQNADEPEYFLASADWMPRNLDHRVEVAFPVLDPGLQAQLGHILAIQLTDSTKAREVLADGHSRYLNRHAASRKRDNSSSQEEITFPTATPLRSQERLYEFTRTGEMLPDIPGSDDSPRAEQTERT